MTEELRCYTFTLYQLSSIQQGIQAGHAAVELTRRGHDLTMNWAKNHKTMVLLNGGDLTELNELVFFMCNNDNPYPWAAFYESVESLAGILTSVAIILPKRIFLTAEAVRKNQPGIPEYLYPETFNEWELGMVSRLAKAGLAR